MNEQLGGIWRLPLRSGAEGVPHDQQVEHCLQRGIAALGWAVANDGTIEGVLTQIEKDYPSFAANSGANTVRRFADAPNGDLLWTLHTDGTYRVGELAGEWRYDGSPEAERLDCVQVRPVRWASKALLSSEVPGAVVRSFSRQGSSFNRIHDNAAQAYSHRLFDKLMGKPERVPAPSREEVLRSLLDPFDIEDLVFVYLQVERGYIVLPGSRRMDTAAYEYVLIERGGKGQATVQVKTGDSTVDMQQLQSAAGDAHKAFAYSTSGAYEGPAGDIELLRSDALLDFMSQHPELLPPRVAAWLDR